MSFENQFENKEAKIENTQNTPSSLTVDIRASKNYIKSLPLSGWTGFKPDIKDDNLWTCEDQHAKAIYEYKDDRLHHVHDYAGTDITRVENKTNCFQLKFKDGRSETIYGDMYLLLNGNIIIAGQDGQPLYQSFTSGGYIRRHYDNNNNYTELDYQDGVISGFHNFQGMRFRLGEKPDKDKEKVQQINLEGNNVSIHYATAEPENYNLIPEKRAAL